MPDNFDTLEKAQAEIVRLNEELTKEKNEKNTYFENNQTLNLELEQVRRLNQQYFNKLSAQFQQDDKDDKEDSKTAPTCEEFAKTLTI